MGIAEQLLQRSLHAYQGLIGAKTPAVPQDGRPANRLMARPRAFAPHLWPARLKTAAEQDPFADDAGAQMPGMPAPAPAAGERYHPAVHADRPPAAGMQRTWPHTGSPATSRLPLRPPGAADDEDRTAHRRSEDGLPALAPRTETARTGIQPVAHEKASAPQPAVPAQKDATGTAVRFSPLDGPMISRPNRTAQPQADAPGPDGGADRPPILDPFAVGAPRPVGAESETRTPAAPLQKAASPSPARSASADYDPPPARPALRPALPRRPRHDRPAPVRPRTEVRIGTIQIEVMDDHRPPPAPKPIPARANPVVSTTTSPASGMAARFGLGQL